jgi:cytochrome c
MKSIIVAGVVATGLVVAGVSGASEDLAQKSGCMKCHAVADKKMGPSFKDISAKYKGKSGSDAAMVAKLKAGKEHPATKAGDDDLNKLVKWVLAM